jgi:hypothetical protein
MTRLTKIAPVCLALVAVSACQMPRFQGPQVQSPPRGFFIQDGTAAAHTLLPDQEPAFHTAWVHADVSGVSTIYIDGYRGRATIEDAMNAVDILRAAAADPDKRFGGIEVLTIDGRQAWGWSESVESAQRGLVEVSYRAVIPYDTITYTVEFTSGEPSFKIAAPDTLRATVASFAVGKTTWNFPQIAMGIGALLLLSSFWRARGRNRSAQLRTINLVQVKKPSGEEEAEGEAAQGEAAHSETQVPVMPGAGP